MLTEQGNMVIPCTETSNKRGNTWPLLCVSLPQAWGKETHNKHH